MFSKIFNYQVALNPTPQIPLPHLPQSVSQTPTALKDRSARSIRSVRTDAGRVTTVVIILAAAPESAQRMWIPANGVTLQYLLMESVFQVTLKINVH